MVRSCFEWWEKIKGGDAVNVWDLGRAVGELKKKFWHFGLKGVAVADRDYDEDDWVSFQTKIKFDLGKEDGGCDVINDDCDKYDDDNCVDNCGDNTSCNISIINFDTLMFPFSIRWKWS